MVNDNMRVVFIRDGDDYWRFVRVIACTVKKRHLLPLLGAGLSFKRPSYLPLAQDLIHPLKTALWRAANPAINDIRPSRSELQVVKQVVDNARLERILDALHQTHGDGALAYLSVLNSRYWNSNHSALAAMAHEGLLPVCITLNFDLLIEEAVSFYGSACITECPLTKVTFEYGKGLARLRIIKPHGSFAPSHVAANPYQYLSATLSQVGSHPARPNINSFSGALSTCPVLFVAGYSDNDWDIFPIVARRMMHLIRQVIWVQHASKEEMQKRILKLQVRSLLNERIIPWIRNTQENSILLIGPVDQFLNDLMKELGVRYLEPINNRKQENLPDASRFISPETVVSLAILIQQSGILSEALLRWLVKHPVVRGNPVLEWKVHDLIGHSRHTWGRINDAIKHTREVIRIKKAYLGPNAIANDLIWLGYEYLCLAKHPGLVRSLFIPLSLIKGLRLLAKGARISDNDSNHLKALSKYYQADLLHGWANAFMMFGQNSIFLTRPLLKMVDWMYDRIEIESDLMDNEYYWLRHLEIHLLLGKTIDREQTEKILSETENSYQLVQNNVQLGNIAAYRGLMSFLLDKDDKAASKYLDRAEELWLRVADNVASGRRRILVFRRLIGSITFWQAISLFLRDAS